ncbi:unnamed protein product [Cylicocyclus nassatus]|uniref:Uncharacterized protein n=1 Tax=Cylicocyclus nassatus TaxID=53992 RepID=A0AA36H4B6_CYLNA|nr:unnamed protein product [Cylicocyclus nassatus]
MSCRQFSNNAEVQFIELTVTTDCYNDEESLKSLKLNNYGILIVNTKSSLMGHEHNFHTTTFVDFNNQKWPKSKEYQAFFTVGSGAGHDTVPTSPAPPPSESTQSPLNDALDIYFSIPSAEEVQDSSAYISPLDERHTRLENRVAKLLEIVQDIAHRQKQFGEQQKADDRIAKS